MCSPAGQPVKRAHDDALYLAVSVSLSHQRQLLTLAVDKPAKCLVVHHADDKPVGPAVFAGGAFLFSVRGVIVLGVGTDAAVDVYNGSKICVPFCFCSEYT